MCIPDIFASVLLEKDQTNTLMEEFNYLWCLSGQTGAVTSSGGWIIMCNKCRHGFRGINNAYRSFICYSRQWSSAYNIL